MTFDKQKVMRSAERYLTQGKIRAAISEYAKVVQQDSKDISTLNMLGDLYVKIDEKDEAVKCFTNVAEYYDKQGFSQKAIAVFNKIARLMPDSVAISEKLAPLYHQKGSIVEARTHYTILAENYQKKGKKLDALNIWKKIADLDPYNTEIYLKLAEGYWQENYKDEAATAFIEAGSRFSHKKNYESAVAVFNRALEIHPLDWVALNGLVTSQISLGNAIEASEKLEKLHQENPYNTDVMLLLVDCYIDQKNLISTEKVLIELVEKEPSSYTKLLDLVHAYINENDVNSAVRVMTMASEHLLVGGKTEEYKALVEEILIRNREDVGALRLMVRYHSWLRDESELKKSLETLFESAQANNLIEDERFALSQLVRMSPHEMRFVERLSEIGGSLDVSDLPVFSESAGEVPTFANFENLANDEDLSGQANYQPGDDSTEFATNQAEFSESQEDFSNTGFSFAVPNTDDSPSDNQPQAEQNLEFDNKVEIQDLQPLPTETAQITETVQTDFSSEISSFEADSSSETQSISESVTDNQNEGLSSTLKAHLLQELESIDFYVSSGYYDLALESLAVIEKQFGKQPEIDAYRQTIDTHTTNIEAENAAQNAVTQIETANLETQTESINVESENSFEIETNNSQVIEPQIENFAPVVNNFVSDDESIQESHLNFEFSETQVNKQDTEIQTTVNAQENSFEIAQFDMGQTDSIVPETTETSFEFQDATPESVTEVISSFESEFEETDSKTETETDSVDSDFDDLMFENIQADSPKTSNKVENKAENGYESFDDFRNDLGFEESETEDYSADYETHFNLGIAYKEMGLMDDAVKEFQDAVKLVQPNDKTQRHLQCCHFLGHCFMDKQMPKLAVRWFEKALESKEISEDEKQALNYEIAIAFEADGDADSAFKYYEQIYAVDVEYRDVASKMKQLA